MGLLPSDPQKQRQMMFAMIPVVGLAAYWYLMHGARTQEIAALTEHVEQLETKNAAAKALAKRSGPELKKKLAMYEAHITRLEELIPRSEEVPELLHTLSMRAEEAGVELALMRPQAEVPGEFYTRQVYDMSVYGPYAGVGRFLAAVGSLPRIVTPIDLKVEARKETDRSGAQRLEASFQIQTYVVPAARPAPPAPPMKGKKS
jgi:type IV pilus assembly protein PilO